MHKKYVYQTSPYQHIQCYVKNGFVLKIPALLEYTDTAEYQEAD